MLFKRNGQTKNEEGKFEHRERTNILIFGIYKMFERKLSNHERVSMKILF